MFNDTQLADYFRRRDLPQPARQLIQRVRDSKPTRRVRSGRCNVATRYASRKMGRTIQAESHKNELPAVIGWDFDKTTYEFYDQPPKIKLSYRTHKGKQVSYLATPDFFLLAERFTGWIECKTEDWLRDVTEEGSTLYVPDGNGGWRCPPGEEYAAAFGLQFKVRSSTETNWVAVRNVQFLADYYDDRMKRPTADEVAAVTRILADQPWIPLKALLEADHDVESDIVYRMIADGTLHVALDRDLLSEPELTPVFRDEVAEEAYRLYRESSERPAISERRIVNIAVGQAVLWDGKPWRIANVGTDDIYLEDEERVFSHVSRATFQQLVFEGKIAGSSVQQTGLSAAEQAIRAASPTDFEHAMKRYRALFPVEGAAPPTFCDRALRKWRNLYRHAAATLGSGFLGLLPAFHRCGNRQRKLDAAVIAIMEEVIKDHYLQRRKKTLAACWGEVRKQCEEKGLLAPSEEAFRQQIRRHDAHTVKQAREGEKAAYVLEELLICYLERTTPRHGERPFEIGHIDHTQVDLQLVGCRRGEKLRKPWLTVLIDSYTRMVLAWVISPDRPSYRSCMAVIRDCVRRHGRVPKTLVVDGGAEFASTYFETLVAYLDCNKKTRPAAKSHFGSVIERVFGVTNKQFIHNLEGNNQALQKPRSMSPTHDPRRHAKWMLETFREAFEGYLDQVYHAVEHPALSLSPKQAMTNGLLASGTRSHTLIPYGPEFVIMCFPTTKRGKAKVVPGRGVKIDYVYYWAPEFREPTCAGTKVPVRYDPEDKSTAFAWIGHRWALCRSEYAADFEGRSEKEVEMASHEIRARHARNRERRAVTATEIAAYLRQTAAKEAAPMHDQHSGPSAEIAPVQPTVALPSPPSDAVSIWDNLTLKIFGDFK